MFKLYTEEKLTFPFNDYALLMQQVNDLGAKSCLEFGPGITTLALIEAGVEKIVTLEHDLEWLGEKIEQFKDYPQVSVGRYHDEPIVLADVEEDFDMAFVDSPQGFTHAMPGRKPRVAHPGFKDCSRLNTCLFALDRAPVVFLHDSIRPLERGTLGRLNAMGYKITQLPSKVGMARIDRNGKDASGSGLSGAV
jgi:hypothetical protein